MRPESTASSQAAPLSRVRHTTQPPRISNVQRVGMSTRRWMRSNEGADTAGAGVPAAPVPGAAGRVFVHRGGTGVGVSAVGGSVGRAGVGDDCPPPVESPPSVGVAVGWTSGIGLAVTVRVDVGRRVGVRVAVAVGVSVSVGVVVTVSDAVGVNVTVAVAVAVREAVAVLGDGGRRGRQWRMGVGQTGCGGVMPRVQTPSSVAA